MLPQSRDVALCAHPLPTARAALRWKMQSRLPPWEPCQWLTQGEVSRGLTVMEENRTLPA